MELRFATNDPVLEPHTLNTLYTAVGWNEGGERTDEKTRLVLERAPYFVVAWHEDTPVGFGRVLTDVYWAQLLDVMTHPDYRRQGIAHEVVSHLVAFADGQSLSLMLISAGGMESLYTRFGFVEANPATDVLMYRPLPPEHPTPPQKPAL